MDGFLGLNDFAELIDEGQRNVLNRGYDLGSDQ